MPPNLAATPPRRLSAAVSAKTLSEQRRALLVWASALLGLLATYVAFYPSVRRDSSYSDLMNQLPDSLRSLFTGGTATDLASPEGYLYTEMLSFMAPLLVLIYAITAGAAGVAGEEDRRTLDLILVSPVSRTRVMLEKVAAMAAGVAVLMTVSWAGLLLFGPAGGLDLPASRTAAAMLHLALLGIEFGALAMLVGCATGRPGLSTALPAVLAVATYLLNAMAPLVTWLQPLRPASPFYQYLGHDPIRTGIDPAALTVTAASITALVAVAAWLFRRRDIHG
jgi:ABC-2 type transport system permease protein